MNGIALGFAELQYLLSDDDAGRRRLQLSPPTGEMHAAGLSSLAARELAQPSDDGPLLDKRLAALIAGLTSARTWIEIGLARPDQTSGIQFFDGENGRAAVLARPFATFLVREVESAEPFGAYIAGQVRDFLAEPPAAVLLKRESSVATTSHLALRARSVDLIELTEAQEPLSDDASLREVDAAAVSAEVSSFVEPP